MAWKSMAWIKIWNIVAIYHQPHLAHEHDISTKFVYLAMVVLSSSNGIVRMLMSRAIVSVLRIKHVFIMSHGYALCQSTRMSLARISHHAKHWCISGSVNRWCAQVAMTTTVNPPTEPLTLFNVMTRKHLPHDKGIHWWLVDSPTRD